MPCGEIKEMFMKSLSVKEKLHKKEIIIVTRMKIKNYRSFDENEIGLCKTN